MTSPKAPLLTQEIIGQWRQRLRDRLAQAAANDGSEAAARARKSLTDEADALCDAALEGLTRPPSPASASDEGALLHEAILAFHAIARGRDLANGGPGDNFEVRGYALQQAKRFEDALTAKPSSVSAPGDEEDWLDELDIACMVARVVGDPVFVEVGNYGFYALTRMALWALKEKAKAAPKDSEAALRAALEVYADNKNWADEVRFDSGNYDRTVFVTGWVGPALAQQALEGSKQFSKRLCNRPAVENQRLMLALREYVLYGEELPSEIKDLVQSALSAPAQPSVDLGKVREALTSAKAYIERADQIFRDNVEYGKHFRIPPELTGIDEALSLLAAPATSASEKG